MSPAPSRILSIALRAALCAALCVALCASLLLSCSPRERTIGIDPRSAFPVRLAAVAAALPPPSGWRLVGSIEGANIILSLGDRSDAAGGDACGVAYRAAAVDLSDPRYSASARDAEAMGLRDLESIEPPLRALAVEGLWPGQSGYPFSYALYLSASSPSGGRLPPEIELWARETAAAAIAAEVVPTRLAAAGDIQIGEAQGPALIGGEGGLSSIIEPSVLEVLRSADLAVANLESPISARGEPNPNKSFHFRMPPGSAKALRDAGFDLLLFGNNHGFDFGPEAFADSLKELSEAAMPIVGAGVDLEEARAAKFLRSRGGERLAFIGFAFYPKERLGFSAAEAAALPDRPGIAIDEAAAREAVREAASTGATVVVLAHGGSEYIERPNAEARALYAGFVDSGAALVLGGHPHVLQGCVARSGSIIAYSLGNFVFTLEEEPKAAWKSLILELLVYKGKVRALGVFPVIAGYSDTRADPDRLSAEIRLSRLSAELEKDG
jgi:poly-gamma-glutamate capsule biosynthesis protein CapA/YwtB (metallophosphatase superfamily)